MMRTLAPLALALTAACTTASWSDRADRDAAAGTLAVDGQGFADGARFAGPARSCVRLTDIRTSRVRSDRVIDFGGPGGPTWRVVLPQSCPGLGFERRFSYSTSLSQLCQQDIITVLLNPPITRGASCGLAPFQPIEPPPRRRS